MLTYQDTGVDPNKNDRLVERISKLTAINTGFASSNYIGDDGNRIVQCTDGTGTKIQLASEYQHLYDSIGYDLVAMCVNDLICVGAQPMFFQDYIGMNNLEEHTIMRIIESIYNACLSCSVKLTGGEMAEMPDTYATMIPELVGFATGMHNANTWINKIKVLPGDSIIGLASAGPHSNGYTLIRRVMANNELTLNTIGAILAPTIIYSVVSEFNEIHPGMIKSIAHITGGGLEANLARAIPDELKADIDIVWDIPEVFTELQSVGNISSESMWETFNMGIGMCLVVRPEDSIKVIAELYDHYNPIIIGTVKTKI